MPYWVDYTSSFGAVLTVDAVGGIQVLQQKITADPQCFHVWGSTLLPFWTTIDCSGFNL